MSDKSRKSRGRSREDASFPVPVGKDVLPKDYQTVLDGLRERIRSERLRVTLAANAAIQAAVEWPVVASGGVSTEEDIVRLAAVPMAGCIIGRALYEKTLTLPAALAAAQGI